MHRSSENQYWAQPRAALSFNGDEVVFDSDFGTNNIYVAYADTSVAFAGTGNDPSAAPVLGATCGSGLQLSVDSQAGWLYVCGGGRWGRVALQF